MKAVCDPRDGIAGEQTFMPSIAELRASLERRMAPIYTRQEREARFAETERLLAELTGATDEERQRAWAFWQDERDRLAGKPTQAEVEAAAKERLRELWHEVRTEPLPRLSEAALAKMARAE